MEGYHGDLRVLPHSFPTLRCSDRANCTSHVPCDGVGAKECAPTPPTRTVNVHEVSADEMIRYVGPAAVEALSDFLKTWKTLGWNGPLGAFETPPFDTA